MVITRTAAASRSSSRLRSDVAAFRSSAQRFASHVVNDARPSWSAVTVRFISWARWRRSVRIRSPPSTASCLASRSRQAETTSNSAAAPNFSNTSTQARSWVLRAATRVSPPASSSAAVKPSSGLSAAILTNPARWGCSRAANSRCQAVAASVVNTLAPPLSTLGTDTFVKASQISEPWSRFRTSTAMSLGSRSRHVSSSRICWPVVSVETMSCARSSAIRGRSTPTPGFLDGSPKAPRVR